MIIKTRASLAGAGDRDGEGAPPYTNPALIVLPILGGSADYLRWLDEETRRREAMR